MMAALAGVVKEDDKDIARKMFRAGDINKQVDEVSKRRLCWHTDGVELLPEKLGGRVRSGSQNITLFKTKICEFPYPIYDLINFRYPIYGLTL